MKSTEEDEIKRFYDNVYYKNIFFKKKISTYQSRLARRLKVTKSKAVLDVACGTGEFLRACNDLGAYVYGVDLSDNAIAACRKVLPEGEFYSCSAEKLPFDDNSFDVVTCLGSLEHFVNPISALREMIRVGKTDASFVILVPNKDFLTRKLGFFGGTYQVDAKEVVRTLDEWDELFRLSGLHVDERWKDLHVLSWSWISLNGWRHVLTRGTQALALTVWPLSWQYQVFHLAHSKKT